MYYYFMTIGDYFDTGHGKFKEILISSRKDVNAIREANFNIVRKTGINLEEICNTYQRESIYIDTYEQIKKAGVQLELEPYPYSEDSFPISPDNMAQIWIELLNIVDPDLCVERVYLDTIHLKDCDNEGRWIRNIGYGCFEND